jgi:hypothetical protein
VNVNIFFFNQKIDFETLFESGMSESKSNEILIGEEENEGLFTEFIKFLYTGCVDTSDQNKLVEFMM